MFESVLWGLLAVLICLWMTTEIFSWRLRCRGYRNRRALAFRFGPRQQDDFRQSAYVVAEFFDGPLDGITMETYRHMQQCSLTFAGGKTYRYEITQVQIRREEDGCRTDVCRMTLAQRVSRYNRGSVSRLR